MGHTIRRFTMWLLIFTKSLQSELLSSVFRGGTEVQSGHASRCGQCHIQSPNAHSISHQLWATRATQDSGDNTSGSALGQWRKLLWEAPLIPPRLGISEVSSMLSSRTQSAPGAHRSNLPKSRLLVNFLPFLDSFPHSPSVLLGSPFK